MTQPPDLEPIVDPKDGNEARMHLVIMSGLRDEGQTAMRSLADRWRLMLYLCKRPDMKARADAWLVWAGCDPASARVMYRTTGPA